MRLYTQNAQLSEAFYCPLQMLEIALRNRIHTVMSISFDKHWFEDESLIVIHMQRKKVEEALAVTSRHRSELPSDIVARLTFGFWTAMFSPCYEKLWQQGLHQIARGPSGKTFRRKDFSGPLTEIRHLRNRIAHHEPIIDRNLPILHIKILEMTEWLSPAAGEWSRIHSRFDQVYPPNGLGITTTTGR